MKPTDRKLIAEIRAGNRSAFTQLIEEYYADLVNHAWQLLRSEPDAEDVIQTLFLKIWQAPEKWHPKISLKAYLYRSATNTALKHIRARKPHVELAEAADLPTDASSAPESNARASELQRILTTSLDDLPERHRIPLLLSRFSDLSYREIAETLGRSVKSIEKSIGKALHALREAAGDYLEP